MTTLDPRVKFFANEVKHFANEVKRFAAIIEPKKATMTTPHKHAALIHAWADGAEIEYEDDGRWCRIHDPLWEPSVVYRIKPEPKLSDKADWLITNFQKALSAGNNTATSRAALRAYILSLEQKVQP